MQTNDTDPNTPQEPVLPEVTILDLPGKLQAGAKRAGWVDLTPVQSRAIPYLFSGRDTMIQSRTGSGKTGAYLLPMLDLLNPLQKHTQALVLVPTRELALQVQHEAEIIFDGTGIRSAVVYGGVGYRDQFKAFEEGAQLVVGTPGRILDHLMRKTFKLENLKLFIFDEADHMLSMGFYPDMRRVQSYLPENHISTYMFSATFPPMVMNLKDQFMQSPVFVNMSSDHIHVSEVDHVYYQVPGMDKDRSLIRIIEVENPVSALIFCNTKVRVEYVTAVLQRFGYDADAITSNLSQTAREKVMESVRQSTLRFLVATDVAARGIDLPELSHVIQYEPPEDQEAYIHRAGRTGRAGASGTAITLVNTLEKSTIQRIARLFEINMEERDLPTDDEVARIVMERNTTLLESALRTRDKLQVERMGRFSALVETLGSTEEGKALLAMLLDDYYQAHFHPAFEPRVSTRKVSSSPRNSTGPSRRRSHRERPGRSSSDSG